MQEAAADRAGRRAVGYAIDPGVMRPVDAEAHRMTEESWPLELDVASERPVGLGGVSKCEAVWQCVPQRPGPLIQQVYRPQEPTVAMPKGGCLYACSGPADGKSDGSASTATPESNSFDDTDDDISPAAYNQWIEDLLWLQLSEGVHVRQVHWSTSTGGIDEDDSYANDLAPCVPSRERTGVDEFSV